MALTWTQGDIDSLKAAVSSGVLSVRYDGPPGRTITYQSLESMRALLADIAAQVATTAGTRKPYRLAATKKGL